MHDLFAFVDRWTREPVDRRGFVVQAARGALGLSVFGSIGLDAVGRIRVKVQVLYATGSPAAGVQVTIQELLTTNQYNLGVTNADGRVEAELRERRQVTVFTNPLCRLPRCPTRQEDDQLDTPALSVMVTDAANRTFTFPGRALYPEADIPIRLPPSFTLAPTRVGHILRRRNLSTDFLPDDRRLLAELILARVDDRVIDDHMHQVDHIGNLFTDHRSYLYDLEKKLIRDGFARFVPLPMWEPLDNIPFRWEEVKRHRGRAQLPLAPYNAVPVGLRPQLPDEMRPERMCAESFATANTLALAFGKSAWSSPSSYHFNAHAALGGPFFQMSTAAAALMFWPFHALLVDVYDRWLACKFGAARAMGLGVYGSDADRRPRMGLFRLGADKQLWHSFQRRTCTMRSETDDVLGETPVTFDHWSHWTRIGAPRELERFKVIQDGAGRMVVLAAGADRRLFMLRGENDTWDAWTDLGAEVGDFAAVLTQDRKLAIVAFRRDGNTWSLAVCEEGPAPGAPLGPWTSLASVPQPGTLQVERDRVGQLHAFYSTGAGQLYHLWKGTRRLWSAPTQFSSGPVRMFRTARNQDLRLQVFILKADDDRIYHRWVNPGTPVAANYNAPGTWSGWVPLGTRQFNHMDVGKNSDGRLEAFGVDRSGRLHHVWQTEPNGSWVSWELMPHQQLIGARATGPSTPRITKVVGAVTDHTDALKVFVHAEDGFIYMAEQESPSSGPWIGWTNL